MRLTSGRPVWAESVLPMDGNDLSEALAFRRKPPSQAPYASWHVTQPTGTPPRCHTGCAPRTLAPRRLSSARPRTCKRSSSSSSRRTAGVRARGVRARGSTVAASALKAPCAGVKHTTAIPLCITNSSPIGHRKGLSPHREHDEYALKPAPAGEDVAFAYCCRLGTAPHHAPASDHATLASQSAEVVSIRRPRATFRG